MIDVKRLFDTVGSTLEINEEYDYSDYDLDGAKPFATPIKVKGKISNRAGAVELNYTLDFTADFQCDRCLSDIKQDFSLSGNHVLTENNSDELDDELYIVCENAQLNLEETVLFTILLNMSSKHLCSRNCKGLCCNCGKNLNEGECNCGTQDND